jgi:hypothetical protein
MKKWMYLIFPGLGLVAFLLVYFPAKHMAEERLAAQAAEVERAKQEAIDKRLELEKKAKEESDARALQNAQERQAQDDAREKKRLDELQHIRDETDTANADADRFSKEADALTAKLAALQQQKEDLTREDFELAKKVQLAWVTRSDADLENERMLDMVATRAAQSGMANAPLPPPASN